MRWRTPLAWKENLWKGNVGAASARRIPQPDQAGNRSRLMPELAATKAALTFSMTVLFRPLDKTSTLKSPS